MGNKTPILNILYALFIHRLSNKALTVLVGLSGIALAWFTLFNVSGYDMFGVGWTLDTVNFFGGTLRMLFPFSMGMLLARHFKPMNVKGAFWICSMILLLLFCVPYIVTENSPISLNGLFEAICILFIFPVLLWIGASGKTTDNFSSRVCKFLGDISYPLYAVHYPIMYLFYAWLINHKIYIFSEAWPTALAVYLGNILLAYLCLKLYDEPVRKWLAKKFLNRK